MIRQLAINRPGLGLQFSAIRLPLFLHSRKMAEERIMKEPAPSPLPPRQRIALASDIHYGEIVSFNGWPGEKYLWRRADKAFRNFDSAQARDKLIAGVEDWYAQMVLAFCLITVKDTRAVLESQKITDENVLHFLSVNISRLQTNNLERRIELTKKAPWDVKLANKLLRFLPLDILTKRMAERILAYFPTLKPPKLLFGSETKYMLMGLQPETDRGYLEIGNKKYLVSWRALAIAKIAFAGYSSSEAAAKLISGVECYHAQLVLASKIDNTNDAKAALGNQNIHEDVKNMLEGKN